LNYLKQQFILIGGIVLMEEFSDRIKAHAVQLGADLVGIADLERLKGIETIPDNLLNPFTRAIVIAYQLSPEVFEQIEDEPTPLYSHQYAAVNQLLDHINLILQSKILKIGYKALAIPASQTLDRERWMGHISTKAVAKAAGLGWQGKSLLLVTPQYGPRVRIACLLTNAPLNPDPVLPNRCGGCTCCKEACPAQAIYGASWEDHPHRRADAVNLEKCVERLKTIAQKQGRASYICGVCIKVCPWGKQRI
jgi:epoxyqueuosine reductase